MAKKFWDGEVKMSTDWGGDISTGYAPLSGERVQEFIKESINSKVGYLGEVKEMADGTKLSTSFYVLCRDEEVFKAYSQTVTSNNTFGDLSMEGIMGRFDAPSNYSMKVEILEPEGGYKSVLANSTENIIRFKAETQDKSGSVIDEGITVTYRIKNGNGVEFSQTVPYSNVSEIHNGIVYNLDGKISAGDNTITITVVGNNTGVSTIRRVTYNLLDIYYRDRFDISKRYAFTAGGVLSIPVSYDLKGVGETTVYYYFDGNLHRGDAPDGGYKEKDENPIISNGSKTFMFTATHDAWMNIGLHTLQIYMKCVDSESKEEFFTPIAYREFVVENTPTELETPYITRKLEFDYSNGILPKDGVPTYYNVKQFENLKFSYAAYYNGKDFCEIETYIEYPGKDEQKVGDTESLSLSNSFSEIKTKDIGLSEVGPTKLYLRAIYEDTYFESEAYIEIGESDMKLTTSEEGVVLYLNAFGRSNDSKDKDILAKWEYKYLNAFGEEEVITTDFSKNEYVIVSSKDSKGNIIPPIGVEADNCLEVSELPTEENKNVDFLIFNGEYYAWNREFDWSNTSGWHDGKLKLANGNAITINYKPFDEDKLETMELQGATFEFEFETTNVYNDDAVICRICGNDNFAPGISIYAAGAELAISREIVTDEKDENAGYAKMVSTKYKSEESNRISFVITPDAEYNGDGSEYRNRILKIYVNGELCGAYAYDNGANFFNDSKITFRGNKDAGINIYSIKLYNRALSSTEILDNFIYYRNDSNEKRDLYQRNNIVLEKNKEQFDSDKLKSAIPVMTFYQIYENEKIEDIHQEKKNKKLARHFDILYVDIQDPSKNFFIKNAYVTPQGTSSMNYPVKNFRIYTSKDKKNPAILYVGKDIFLDGNSGNRSSENLNPECLVAEGAYAFKDASIPVKCWCLKADFAESSSSHNTGTSRFWNEVLKNAGYITKAQAKAAKYQWGETLKDGTVREYDVRTCVDGFPIVLFYERLGGEAPEFQGKYNFNNDKSTEDVFGFTGGMEIEDQKVEYFYIGKEKPIIHGEEDEETGIIEWECSWSEGGYTSTPDTDSDLYTSKYLEDGTQEWYMLRGKELLDNPKMECWELLNSVNELALFKTAKNFMIGDGDEKVGIPVNGEFDGAFESRYPDCGGYYHTNTLRRFCEWLVSCRYLMIDNETGAAVPFPQAALPIENYHHDSEGKLMIQSLTKKTGTFKFNYPNYNFYTEVPYDSIKSKITADGYAITEIEAELVESIIAKEVSSIPLEKDSDFEYLLYEGKYYTWKLSNTLYVDELPTVQDSNHDYICIGTPESKENGKYYVWLNEFSFSDYYDVQHVDDTSFNRALKFAIEKYDHIEMNKMAAYYIYLMRFGGVDQTVKNSMLTTEGPNSDDPNSTLPSLWYFINYDNDTILGVKNDGRLVFDPYITRETKDGTGYVYAGRESTLWNNLEADVEFMDHVTVVDNKLTDSTSNPMYSLSYANAIREYDVNQSDKWCERIYNKDAETKYIDTYVKGWTQKIEADNSETHVFEDYLYDVQGSRSAHRKWWLGRRFNVYDSRFANANFRASLIKFRSTNLPAGSSFTIKSGEPVYYAWGHDNVITQMTKNALLPGETETFITASAFNIGSFIEVMGAANISTFDLRGCVGALNAVDVSGCYSPLIGTKLKELLIGNHEKTDLINNDTAMNFAGLEVVEKLEVLDITNIKNIEKLDGLNKLLNIRNVYAKGTTVSNFTFTDGCLIEYIELPSTTQTLSLTKSSMITYENIVGEDPTFAKLNNLTIIECKNLMNDFDFVMKWLAVKSENNEMGGVNINLQGIDWELDGTNIEKLFYFEEIPKNSTRASLNIRGTIRIEGDLTVDYINRLKYIFGNDCFKEGSAVYIIAKTGIYLSGPSKVYEDDKNGFDINITTVGTSLKGEVTVSASVMELENGESVLKVIDATDGIITMDTSNLKRGIVTVHINESNKEYTRFRLNVDYRDEQMELPTELFTVPIYKRLYPSSVSVFSYADSYSDKVDNALIAKYTPESINNLELEGRGVFSVKWDFVSGTTGYENLVVLKNKDEEKAYIQTPNGFDGSVCVRTTVIRDYDGQELCYGEKNISFSNPDTIITPYTNPEIYKILVDAGIIEVDETGYGKLDKTGASNIGIRDLLTKDAAGNVRSIFYGHNEITGFTEFQYFKSSDIGQMPEEGNDSIVLIPDEFFGGCTNLKEIAFSSSFYYTGNRMFKDCINLEHVYGPQEGTTEDKTPIYGTLRFKYIGDEMCFKCTKLKTFKLSNSYTEYIGSKAFACESDNPNKVLTTFTIPAIEKLTIAHTIYDNPFMGCPNITFNGATYDSSSKAHYQIFDNAVYEVNDDSVLLIHMGKESKFENMLSDVPVYMCAYSAEHYTGDEVVIPENVIINGNYAFNRSKIGKVVINSTFNGNNANECFCDSELNEVVIREGETYIPRGCFRKCKTLINIVFPETLETIDETALQYCESITTLTIPKNVNMLGSNWVQYCYGLKNIYMLPMTPPNTGYGNALVSQIGDCYINVHGDAYANYMEKYPTYRAMYKLSYLPTKGHFNIVEDSTYYYVSKIDEEDTTITVGGIPTIQRHDGYFEFTTDGSVTNTDIMRNGNKIGVYLGDYMTVYLGDNLSCYSGNGIDFTRGAYDVTKLQQMGVLIQNDNWEYDVRVNGFKSPKIGSSETSVAKFDFSKYYDEDGKLRMVYGQLSEDAYDFVCVHDENTIIDVHQSYDKYTYVFLGRKMYGDDLEIYMNPNGLERLHYTWRKDSGNDEMLDSFWIKEIGNPIFNYPAYPMEHIEVLKLKLTTDNGKPSTVLNGVAIAITDGENFNEKHIWDGTEFSINLPKNKKYMISVHDIQDDYKNYFAPEACEISTANGEIQPLNLVFTTIPVGVYPLNADGTYDEAYDESKTYYGVLHSSLDYDIYINKNIYNSKWGDIKGGETLSYTSEDELLTKNLNGYDNNTEIKNELGNLATIVHNISNNKEIGGEIAWFLPSYYELVTMVNTDDVIQMLKQIGGAELFGHTIWTSNVPDANNAWCYLNTSVEGVITDTAKSVSRVVNGEYRMIGKKIL